MVTTSPSLIRPVRATTRAIASPSVRRSRWAAVDSFRDFPGAATSTIALLRLIGGWEEEAWGWSMRDLRNCEFKVWLTTHVDAA